MNKTTKSAFHRGFTLIELMIVIVILGILMGTILPRLSGAQSRARDTGRVADMNSIAQALELYYDDFGKYPSVKADGTPDCLAAGNLTDFDVLKTYFKGESVPTPPSKTESTVFDGVTCTGTYMYMALNGKGSKDQAYALLGNTETPSKANVIVSNGVTTQPPVNLTYDASTTINDVLAVVNADKALGADAMIKADAEDKDGNSTLYVVASGL